MMRRAHVLLFLCLFMVPACTRWGKRGRPAIDSEIADTETSTQARASEEDGEADEPGDLAEAAKRNAELERRLDDSTRQVEQLRRELEATKRQLGSPGARDKAAAPELWGHTPASMPPGVEAQQPAEAESPQTIIASLRQALTREQQRRESIEKELARLRIETSEPVFGDTRIPESDFLAVKQELVELRRTLEQERRTRDSITEQLRALQNEKSRPAAASASSGAESAEMRARLRKLEDDKRKILESLDRSVATSQRRAAELERRLQGLRTTSGGRAEALNAIQAENAALRASLEEERKRTELLAAKLKAATRITDVINDIRE